MGLNILAQTPAPPAPAVPDYLKKQGTNSIFIKIATAPADDVINIEEGAVYLKQIDANNDGVFIKGKRGGMVVDGQIF